MKGEAVIDESVDYFAVVPVMIFPSAVQVRHIHISPPPFFFVRHQMLLCMPVLINLLQGELCNDLCPPLVAAIM